MTEARCPVLSEWGALCLTGHGESSSSASHVSLYSKANLELEGGFPFSPDWNNEVPENKTQTSCFRLNFQRGWRPGKILEVFQEWLSLCQASYNNCLSTCLPTFLQTLPCQRRCWNWGVHGKDCRMATFASNPEPLETEDGGWGIEAWVDNITMFSVPPSTCCSSFLFLLSCSSQVDALSTYALKGDH